MHKELSPKDFSFQSGITEFNNILFVGFDLANTNFEQYEFCNCKFISCNLSMCKLENALLDDVVFISCKLMGIDFSRCSRYIFTVTFIESVLSYTFFERNRMSKTHFDGCVIHEATFSDADLSSSIFSNCDLYRTQFSGCKLYNSDFRTSVNYSINPSINQLKRARFSYDQISGLLDCHDIIIE